MNSNMAQLAETVHKMHAAGITIPDDVERSLEEFDNPVYKIGVVGRFQTGKSHLINEVFLNRSLLLEEGAGAGICTTAITTEISYGEIPQLIVNYKNGEPTRIIQNPCADDVRVATSSTTPDVRRKIVAEVESVRIEWPCESLKKFSVYDTAGIDDPDPELLQMTTYKTIPEMDVAVMVVAARALSQCELNFLRQSVFKCGIGKILILVSYNPNVDLLSEVGRAELLESIRGQLSEIGRGDIAVRMVCYDPGIADILNSPEAIYSEIAAFAEETAVSNRYTKLSMRLKKVLTDRIRDLKFRLGLIGKTENELLEMQHDLEQLEEELKTARGDMQEQFDGVLKAITQEEAMLFRGGCDKIVENYMTAFNATEGIGEAQEKLKNIGAELVPQIENAAVVGFNNISKRIVDELAKINGRLVSICAECEVPPILFSSNINVDGGICATLNSKAVTIADYIISMMILPGGLITAFALRFGLGLIPIVRNVMPLSLAKMYMSHKVGSSLADEIDRLEESFGESVSHALGTVRRDIFNAIFSEVDARISEAAKAAATRCGSGTFEDRDELVTEVERCEGMLATL